VIQSERYKQLMDRIDSFEKLMDNWDGYGGAKISEEAIKQVRQLINTQFQSSANALSMPEISPTSNGTIVVEWQEGGGEAAVEIGTSRVSGFVRSATAPIVRIRGESKALSSYFPLFVGPMLDPNNLRARTITKVEYEAAENG
jgi:hypothetical protein